MESGTKTRFVTPRKTVAPSVEAKFFKLENAGGGEHAPLPPNLFRG